MTGQSHFTPPSKPFKTTLFFAFRSYDKESSYVNTIEQRRGWLDSIVFGLQFLVLSFSSYRIYTDDVTGEHRWIVPRRIVMAGMNFLGMVMYTPPFKTKLAHLSKYLVTLRIPLLAISHLFLSFMLRVDPRIPIMVHCSHVWVEAAAIEMLLGLLIWQSLFPIFAAFPFYVAIITIITNVGVTYRAIFDMCYFGFETCPRSSAQYLLISKIFRYVDIILPTTIADAADQLDLPRCTKSLGLIQISFLGPISLFIVMVVEIKNRRTYASFESWDRDRQELEKRQQPLWKSCGELFLALVLTRQVLLTWYDHLYRENFPGE